LGSFWGKRELGFAIAGRVGVAKKYLECHEGSAEDGAMRRKAEPAENMSICGMAPFYVDENLNVAGTRGSKETGVWKFAYDTTE